MTGLLTESEKLELRYLQRANKPLWGGHLKRKEPITDPKMQRWLDLGLIEAVRDDGYMLTATGIEFLNQ
jgi:hypothetical protein